MKKQTFTQRGDILMNNILDHIIVKILKSQQFSSLLPSRQRCLKIHQDYLGDIELVVPAWSDDVKVITPKYDDYFEVIQGYEETSLSEMPLNLVCDIADVVENY